MMWWYGDGGLGWGGWLVMSLSMLVFWGLLIWGVVTLVRWSARSSSTGTDRTMPETPEQILARRLASGEISSGQYQEALDTLRGKQSAGV